MALGAFVYLTMVWHIEGTLRPRLTHLAESIAVLTPEASSLQGERPFLVSLVDSFEDEDTAVQFLDASGTIVVPSARLGPYAIAVPPTVLELASRGTPAFYRTAVEGASYLVGIFRMAPSSAGPGGFVLVATDERERSRTISVLLYVLTGGGVVSIVLVFLMGWAMAGTALKPIREAIATARSVALSRSFSQKLTPRDSRDELGEMVTAFNEMFSKLEAAQTVQQRFIADASHELRAPLTVIRGNLDLLERARDKLPQEQVEILRAARAEAERMSRLVADLLSLARADSGMPLEMAEVELDSVVMETHQQLVASSPPVRLGVSGLQPVLVRGDRDRLKQLVRILMDNAIRYTPAVGSVNLSLSTEGPWALLTVGDTGIGIEPEDLPHVFERFYRSQRAREMDPDGTGLGLAIARWIVDGHGGELNLKSTPGVSTIATVRLPLLRS